VPTIAFSLDHPLSRQEAKDRIQQHLMTAAPKDTLWNDFWVEDNVLGFRIEYCANHNIRVVRGMVQFKEGTVAITAETSSRTLVPLLPGIEAALKQAAQQALAVP
jgi:hypothetical protein